MVKNMEDRKYQVMPDMPPDQFRALKKDIAERGILTPIDIDESGNILDGHHRIRACEELDVTDYPSIIRPGLSEEEKRMFARKSNMMRRHLSRKQIREIIRLQLIDTPRWANNRIALELGIDSKTIKTMREKLESTSEIPKFKKYIGADGKERPAINKRGIVVTNKDQREELLKKLKEGMINIDGIPDGFFDSESIIIFECAEPTKEEKKELEEWEFFFKIMFEEHNLMPPTYPDWIIRKYKDPEDFIKNWPPAWHKGNFKKSKKILKFENDVLKRMVERRKKLELKE